MRKHLRDAIKTIEDAGGTGVVVDNSSARHTRIRFNANGRKASVLIHMGGIVTKFELRRLRSQVRRKMERMDGRKRQQAHPGR